MEKEILYCIPGLGLDHRVFEKLDLPNYELKFLDWIPATADEKILDYAKRLATCIKERSFSLLGVSLGGIAAIEISKIKKVNRLILISTIKHQDEMPAYLKWMNKFPANQINAAKMGVELSIALKPFYDKADKIGNELFQKMVRESSPEFINWGVKVIAQWELDGPIETPYLHLHGTDDMVFPIKNIDNALTIKGGTHFMIFNDGEKISNRIEKIKWEQ